MMTKTESLALRPGCFRVEYRNRHLGDIGMTNDDPYDTPKTESANSQPTFSLLLTTVGVVFGTGLLGGLIGTLIGAALGAFIPGYYRAVFRNGSAPDFDPIAVGIGQGLTQGVAFGGIVGIILVALFYWHRSRL